MKNKKARIAITYLIFVLILLIMPARNILAKESTLDYSSYDVSTKFNMEKLQSGKDLTASVSVTNNGSDIVPIMSIVALYDDSGMMINISYISKVIPIGSTDVLSAGFKLPNNITNHVVKVFVWGGINLDNTNMNPLSNIIYISEDGILGDNKNIPLLKDPQFNGLTRIKVQSDYDLSGIGAQDIQITLPDDTILSESKIITANYNNVEKILMVEIDSTVFARITSKGTTIATKAFGNYKDSEPAVVKSISEPATNGYINSRLGWTHHGHNTNYNLFTSPQPNIDINGKPIVTSNGTKVPVEKDFNMLVLFVEFPNEKNNNSTGSFGGIQYNSGMQAYMDLLSGTKQWYANSSYDQVKFKMVSPQNEGNTKWIQMRKNSADYVDNGFFTTGALHHAYISEACQYAFDEWGIRADDYDGLCIIPAKSQTGLRNGPAFIGGNAVAYKDNGTNHYIKTAITAGEDLYHWGYRWVTHETGHTFGLSDLYGWDLPHSMFWVGHWGVMGDIGGQSSEHYAWEKYKFGWIRDDQVEAVTQKGETTHYLSPLETPGGSKLAVVPINSSLAYVVEFRTKQANNAERAQEWGVLVYKIDTTVDIAQGPVSQGNVPKTCLQVISNKWYKDGYTTAPFRPIDSSIDGYGSGCCFQPGDHFTDVENGITIRVEDITNYNLHKSDGLYNENDIATISIVRE